MNNFIQNLNPRHHKILDLYLKGLSKVQIAERLDMTPSSISIITRSPNFQHELAMRMARISEISDGKIADSNEEVSNVLKEATLKAAKKIIDKMESAEEGISFKASCEVLDRGGFPKATRLDANIPLAPQIILSADQIGCLADALKEEKQADNTSESNVSG